MGQIAIASAIGGVTAAASYLLFGNQSQKQRVEGRRLGSSTLTTSTEGEGIVKLFGRQRLDGQIIWATQFKETVSTSTTTTQTGGKGGGGSVSTETTNYTYSISLAIAFCEGNSKTTLSRMWADGKELDLSLLNYRFYPGSQTQGPDSKIQEIQGVNNTPAYRGVTYIVLEDMELAAFGNRVPQVTAEIVVPIETDDPVDIQNSARAFCLIPGTGETAYSPSEVTLRTGGAAGNYTTRPDNIHNAFRQPDVRKSLDDLNRMQNNLEAVLVPVAWFGNDMRTHTDIRPGLEGGWLRDVVDRVLNPSWSVATYSRTAFINYRERAHRIGRDAQGRPVFGGTPSDQDVIELIQHIKALGKRVIFYPFILLDIPFLNFLPRPEWGFLHDFVPDLMDPRRQPPYPWRGRIEISQDRSYNVDDSLIDYYGVRDKINGFFDLRYDPMVQHYADLCATAGGVDAFIIGSQLSGITDQGFGWDGDVSRERPAVNRLIQLAAYAKTALPSAKISYEAHWTEFVTNSNHSLDPLWANENIDFCSIANYLPISDWRDGTQHADYDSINGPVSEYDRNYLASQIEGGEYYDYEYRGSLREESQTRTPLTRWENRLKDLRSWWLNPHFARHYQYDENNRPTIMVEEQTEWVPGSKPVWFTQFGFPAVNKGTNNPDAFYDPKSSESSFPRYSTEARDDLIQRIAIETVIQYWTANSPQMGDLKMIEPQNMFIWGWDARPFPGFPARSDIWSDTELWSRGHSLNGRLESVPLSRLIAHLCDLAGLTPDQYDTTQLEGAGALVRGFQIDRPETIRTSIETLMQAYLFDAFESEGKIKFALRSNTRTSSISDENFVVSANDPAGVTLTRAQETDLPSSASVTFIDEFNNYNSTTVSGHTLRGNSQNIQEINVPITLNADYARAMADSWIQAKWAERQRGTVALPPSMLKYDPGDAITFPVGGNNITARLTTIQTGDQRNSEFVGYDSGVYTLPAAPSEERLPSTSNIFGSSTLVLLDLPLFTGRESLPHAPRIAANASPWPGEIALYRQLIDSTYKINLTHSYRNAIGQLNSPLSAGPVGIWDRGSMIDVTFDHGALSSATESSVLESAIALGIYNQNLNEWEIIQFATATLTETQTYNVTDLLRGQLGTEHAMPDQHPTGARVVLLEPAFLSTANITDELAGQEQTYSWGPSRYPQTDAAYQNATFTGKRTGLRPYSIANLEMGTNQTSDLIIAWKRRTRFGGDSWAAEEIPLNEETEQYRVRIYNNDNIVREIIASSPTYTYTSDQQVADFGAIQTMLKVDVSQYGAYFGGYGVPVLQTLNIKWATTLRRNTDATAGG